MKKIVVIGLLGLYGLVLMQCHPFPTTSAEATSQAPIALNSTKPSVENNLAEDNDIMDHRMVRYRIAND